MGKWFPGLLRKAPTEAETRETPCPPVEHNNELDQSRLDNLAEIGRMATREARLGSSSVSERVYGKKDVTRTIGPMVVVEAVDFSTAQLEALAPAPVTQPEPAIQ